MGLGVSGLAGQNYFGAPTGGENMSFLLSYMSFYFYGLHVFSVLLFRAALFTPYMLENNALRFINEHLYTVSINYMAIVSAGFRKPANPSLWAFFCHMSKPSIILS